MPHPVEALRRMLIAPLAALLLVACARSAELRVYADSTAAPGAVEVLAIPVDRAAALAPDRAHVSADSLATLYGTTRAQLNARAESLSRADRRTAGYAAAYDSFAVARAAAEQLRAQRDSARRASPPHPIPDSLYASATRASFTHDSAALTLHVGEWLLAIVNSHRALVHPAIPVELKAHCQTSVRLATLGPAKMLTLQSCEGEPPK